MPELLEPRFDVVSIGAATVDIFVKSGDFVVDHNRLVLPYSSKNEIKESLICSGGGATNSSVSFSRLGLKSACLSLLGQDPLRDFVLSDLTSEHVDTSLLVSRASETTDYSIILIAPDGGRTILTNRGPSRLEESDISWDAVQSTRWFYITSLEGNLDLLEQLIGFAKEHNIHLSFNPGLRELAQKTRLLPLLPHLDFLLLNKIESEYFSPSELLLPPITAVTHGRDGAFVYANTQKLYSPILNTTPVDETGAGDSFGSAFVAALAHNHPPDIALHWAIKNSASMVSSIGAKTGLLTLSEITSS